MTPTTLQGELIAKLTALPDPVATTEFALQAPPL